MMKVTSTGMRRLKKRQRRIWHGDYLVYRRLWANLERAVKLAREQVVAACPIVVDVGCGESPYLDFFEGCHYVGLNYGSEAAKPQVIGDALHLPFSEGSVDILFATQVIEHVRNPFKMIEEVSRVLRKGGTLVLSGPFYWPIHEAPHDYFRFTKYGFRELIDFGGLELVELRPDGGDLDRFVTSVNLSLPGKVLAPLRAILNIFALLFPGKKEPVLPLNYTMLARKR